MQLVPVMLLLSTTAAVAVALAMGGAWLTNSHMLQAVVLMMGTRKGRLRALPWFHRRPCKWIWSAPAGLSVRVVQVQQETAAAAAAGRDHPHPVWLGSSLLMQRWATSQVYLKSARILCWRSLFIHTATSYASMSGSQHGTMMHRLRSVCLQAAVVLLREVVLEARSDQLAHALHLLVACGGPRLHARMAVMLLAAAATQQLPPTHHPHRPG